MNFSINPEDYNLNKRILLKKTDSNTIGIVKKRKSRIIMKDGEQILKIAKQIRNINKEIKIALIINGPICSKTKQFLAENNINVISEE